jgi:hypothetical protein
MAGKTDNSFSQIYLRELFRIALGLPHSTYYTQRVTGDGPGYITSAHLLLLFIYSRIFIHIQEILNMTDPLTAEKRVRMCLS